MKKKVVLFIDGGYLENSKSKIDFDLFLNEIISDLGEEEFEILRAYYYNCPSYIFREKDIRDFITKKVTDEKKLQITSEIGNKIYNEIDREFGILDNIRKNVFEIKEEIDRKEQEECKELKEKFTVIFTQLEDKTKSLRKRIDNLDNEITSEIENQFALKKTIIDNQIRSEIQTQIDKSKERYEKKQKFYDYIQNRKYYEVKYGKLEFRGLKAGTAEPELTQKRVDVEMAIDMVKVSLSNRVDTIAIVAGDSDFIPALKMCKEKFVNVVLYYQSSSIHNELLQEVDVKKDINNILNKSMPPEK